jgi:hypothetical protein
VCDRQLLLFGQRLDRYARARDRDIEHLPAGRGYDANVGAIMPDLFEFDPQFFACGGVKLIPAVKQQQQTAPFGEPQHVILFYVFEG